MSTWPHLNAWAETSPITDPHPGWKGAVIGDPCPICGTPLAEGDRCYAVIELDRNPDGGEQWVCPLHIAPPDPLRTGPLIRKEEWWTKIT